MNAAAITSDVRERSRSARERSRSLRVTSQHLRESMENLRAYAAEVNESVPAYLKRALEGEKSEIALPPLRTPMDFASLMRQRVQRARMEAQALRRRAAGLRQETVEIRARSRNLLSNSVAN